MPGVPAAGVLASHAVQPAARLRTGTSDPHPTRWQLRGGAAQAQYTAERPPADRPHPPARRFLSLQGGGRLCPRAGLRGRQRPQHVWHVGHLQCGLPGRHGAAGQRGGGPQRQRRRAARGGGRGRRGRRVWPRGRCRVGQRRRGARRRRARPQVPQAHLLGAAPRGQGAPTCHAVGVGRRAAGAEAPPRSGPAASCPLQLQAAVPACPPHTPASLSFSSHRRP